MPPVRPVFLLLLSVAGFLVVLSSSIGSHIESIPTSNQFGLLQMLPPMYWVGIGTMAIALALGMRAPNHIVFFAQAMLLYIAIWSATSLFESYASVWDAYNHYQSAQNIIRIGHLSSDFSFTYENNYPGLFMLTAAFSILAQPDPFSFLRFYSLFASAITLLAIYLFARTYFPGLDHRLAVVLAMMADVWVQVAFSPQSVGLVAGLLVFVFLEKEGREWQALAIVSFAFVVISHPTSTIFVVGGLVSREIFVTIRKHWRPLKGINEHKHLIVGVMMIFWIFWLLTEARPDFQPLLTDMYHRLSYLINVTESVSGTVGSRTGGNLWPYAPYIRLATVGVFSLMALVAIALGFRKRFRNERIPTALLVLFIVPFFFIPLDVILLNSQLYDRGILFLILSSSVILIFGFKYVSSIKPLRLAAIAIALMMAAACWSTVYYQESLNVVSHETIDASHFLADRLPTNTTVIGGRLVVPVWQAGIQEYSWHQYYVYNETPLGNLTNQQGMSVAVVFDHSSDLWGFQYGNASQVFYENKTRINNNNKVYDNGNYWVIYGWKNANYTDQ